MSASAGLGPQRSVAKAKTRGRLGLAERLCTQGPLEDLIEIGRRAGSNVPKSGSEGVAFMDLFEQLQRWASRPEVAPDLTMADFIVQVQAAGGYKPLKARVAELREMEFRGVAVEKFHRQESHVQPAEMNENNAVTNDSIASRQCASLDALPTDVAARIARNRQAALERRRAAQMRFSTQAPENKPQPVPTVADHEQGQPESDDEPDLYDVMEAQLHDPEVENDLFASTPVV